MITQPSLFLLLSLLGMTIAETVLQDDAENREFVTLQVTAFNTGATALQIPASLDARRVQADGNKGRKTLLVSAANRRNRAHGPE